MLAWKSQTNSEGSARSAEGWFLFYYENPKESEADREMDVPLFPNSAWYSEANARTGLVEYWSWTIACRFWEARCLRSINELIRRRLKGHILHFSSILFSPWDPLMTSVWFYVPKRAELHFTWPTPHYLYKVLCLKIACLVDWAETLLIATV